MHEKQKRFISLIIAMMLVFQNIAPMAYASDLDIPPSEVVVVPDTSEENTPTESSEAAGDPAAPVETTAPETTVTEQTTETTEAEESTGTTETKESIGTTETEESTGTTETEESTGTTETEESTGTTETEESTGTTETEETTDTTETEETAETKQTEAPSDLPDNLLHGPLLTYEDVGLRFDPIDKIVYLEDARDLLLLSLLPESLYQDHTIFFGEKFDSEIPQDLSRQYVDILDGDTLSREFFSGLGHRSFPFQGRFITAENHYTISLVLNCALFRCVSTQFRCSSTLNLTATPLRDEDADILEAGQSIRTISPWNTHGSIFCSEFRMDSGYTCRLNLIIDGNLRSMNSLMTTTSGGDGTLEIQLYASGIGYLNGNPEGRSGLVASTHGAGTIRLLSGSTKMENMIGTKSDNAVFIMDDAEPTTPSTEGDPTEETETSSETVEETETTYPEGTLFAPFASFLAVGLSANEADRIVYIDSAKDLVRLSLLPAELYQNYTLSFGASFTDGADLSREYIEVVEDGALTRRFFRSLGSEQAPFSGSFAAEGGAVYMTINRTLFRCVSTQFRCSYPLTLRLSDVTEEETLDAQMLPIAEMWDSGSSVLASDFRMDSGSVCKLDVTLNGNQKTIQSLIGTTSGQDGTLNLRLVCENIGQLVENEEGKTGLVAATHGAGTISLASGSNITDNAIGTISNNAVFHHGSGSGTGGDAETGTLLTAPLNSFADVQLNADPETMTVSIANAQDLLRLSLLPEALYQNYTIVFLPEWNEGNANDLSQQYADVLYGNTVRRCFFRGLGSSEYPFAGEFISSLDSISFVLNTALFRGLAGGFRDSLPIYLKLSDASAVYAPIPETSSPAAEEPSDQTEEVSDAEESSAQTEEVPDAEDSSEIDLGSAELIAFSDVEEIPATASISAPWDGGNILASELNFQDGDQLSLDLNVDGNGQSARGILGSTTGGDGTLELTLNQSGLSSLNAAAGAPAGILADSHNAGSLLLTDDSSVQENLPLTGTDKPAGLLGTLSNNAKISYPEEMGVALFSARVDGPVREGTMMTVLKPLNQLRTFEDVGINSYNPITETIQITSALDLVALSLLPAEVYAGYTLDFDINWAGHENNQDLTIAYVDVPVDSDATKYERKFFQGLGSATHPFAGAFLTSEVSQNSGIKITLNRSLFKDLSSEFSCNIDPLILNMGSGSSSPTYDANNIRTNTDWDSNSAILAENYHFVSGASKDLSLQVVGNGQNFTGLIGCTDSADPTLTENAVLNLKLVASNLGTATAKDGSGNAGMLARQHNAGNLNLVSIPELPNKIDSQLPTHINVDGTGSVGVLFGSVGQNAGFSSDAQIKFTHATLSGKTIGGLIGEAAVDDDKLKLSNVSIQEIDIPSTSTASIVGGVIGKLQMDAEADLRVSDSVSIDLNQTTGSLGGLVGEMVSKSLQTTLTVSGNPERAPTITTHAGKTVTQFGGLVGKASNGCIRIEDAAPIVNNAQAASISRFGGAVGLVSDGCIVDLCDEAVFAPGIEGAFTVGTACGGVIGEIGQKCALRMGGKVDITNFAPDNSSIRYGKIVGKQTSSLIFSDSDGYAIIGGEDKLADDIGNYGGVIRNEQLSSLCTQHGGSCPGVISYTDRTDTDPRELKILGTLSDTIANECDFARLAIYYQTKGTFFPENSSYAAYSACLNHALTIPEDAKIDMTDTGIYGLQRDFVDNSNSVEPFRGSLTCGDGSSLTLDFGTIYRHNRIGLFGNTQNASIENLNLTMQGRAECLNATYCGGVAAQANGTIAFKDVKVAHAVTAGGSISLGALIGYSNCTKIDVTNTPSGGDADVWVNYSGGSNRIGGLIGTAENNANKAITITGTSIGSRSGNGRSSISSTANFGGLISHMEKGSSNSLVLNSVRIDGMDLTHPEDSDCGGFIGHTLTDVDVMLNGVTVQNGSITGRRFGGLAYSASGYWDLASDGKSVTMNNLDLTCKDKKEEASSALMVVQGVGLYLEVDPAKFIRSDVRVTVSNTNSFYFDELVGKTREKNAGDGGQGIVSIVSDPHTINQGNRNTYSSSGVTYNGGAVSFDDIQNPYTRYYYDLDVYRKNPENLGQKFLLWSVSRIATDGIKNRFFADYSTFRADGGEVDLTGLSYYPVDHNGSADLNGATVIFDYEAIQETEKDSGSKRTLNSTDSQHSMMQCGLFRNAGSLNLSNLTLKGNVGKTVNSPGLEDQPYAWLDGSGALVCGTLSGGTSSLSNIAMENLSVSGFDKGDNYAPLLINRIGSNETLTVTGLQAVAEEAAYCDGKQVATSLIGDVGDEQAHDIHLNFSAIHLDGRQTPGAEAYPYGSTNSAIFTKATLLNKFQYTASSSGGYYFNQDEDSRNASGWGDPTKTVTYGFEITGTKENAVETEDDSGNSSFESMQREYFEYTDMQYVTKAGPATAASKDEFNTGYLPYVAISPATVTENLPTGSHELDVNLKKGDLTKGCGTYEDPYIINSPLQLTTLAYFLSNGRTEQGWNVNVKPSGSGLCDQTANGHDTYTSQPDATWLSEDGLSMTDSQMSEYLSGAYYRIDKNIKCNNFPGLGSETNPFRGVIYGYGSNVKLTTSSQSNLAGGLIAYSSGSVVKNLIIRSEITAELNEVARAFSGGVIGTVLGGESIIDNVTVEFTASLNGSYSRLICTGGYVGLLQNGGVIFRNVSDGNCSVTAASGDSFLYSNRCIGRVLDGYAYSDGCQLNNAYGDAALCNYYIHQVTSSGSTVVNGSVITIRSAEELWALSAYVNSQSGFGNSASKQKAHIAAYDLSAMAKGVGSAGDDYNLSRKYNEFGNASSLEGLFGLSNALDATQLDLSGNLDLTVGYYNGFRGIGTKYDYSSGISNVRLKVSAINQEPSKVTLGMQMLEYDTDPYRGVGAGMITSLKSTAETTVKNLTVSGFVTQDKHYNALTGAVSTTADYMSTDYYAGGIIGRCDSKLTLDNCVFGDIHVTANRYAGGLIGYCGGALNVTWRDSMQAADIISRELNGTYNPNDRGKAIGGSYGGSIAGFCSGVLTIDNAVPASVTSVKVQHQGITDGSHLYRVGGLVGGSGGQAHIRNVNLSGLEILGAANPTGSHNPDADSTAGGVIGTVFGATELDSVIVSAESDQKNVIFGKAAGGFIGRTEGAATLTNCRIAGIDESHPLFIYGNQRCSAGVTFVKNGSLTITGCTFGGDQPKNLQLYSTTYTMGCAYAKIETTGVCTFQDSTFQNLLVLNASQYGASFCLGGVASGATNVVENITISDCIGLLRKNGTKYVANGSCFGALASSVEHSNTNLYAGDVYISNISMGCITNNKVTVTDNGIQYNEADVTHTDEEAKRFGAMVGRITLGIPRIQIVGVTYQGNRPASDIALYGSDGHTPVTKDHPAVGSDQTDVELNLTGDSFIIYADYTGSSGQGSLVTTSPSGTTIPLEEGDLPLTGDGACFGGTDPKTGVLKELYQEVNEGSSNYYWKYFHEKYTQSGFTTLPSHKDQTVNTYVQNFPDYWNGTGLDVTTYKTLQAPDGSNALPADFQDFPVLRVTSGFDVLLALELLTNGSFQIARDAGVVTAKDLSITTYYWDDTDGFKVYRDTRDANKAPMPSLEYHFLKTDSNHDLFTIPAGRSDKGSNKLTLVTVDFCNKKGQTYTLYLPVVVDKPIYVSINAMAANGPEFRFEGDYFVSSSVDKFTASYGDTVSFLLDYQYTYDDWGALPKDWHFEKVLHTSGSMPSATLPAGTRATLIDLNGKDSNGKDLFLTYTATITEDGTKMLDLCKLFVPTGWNPIPTASLPEVEGNKQVKEEQYILILDLPNIFGDNSVISSMHEGPLDCAQNTTDSHDPISPYANVVKEENHTNFIILPSFKHVMTITSEETRNAQYPPMKDPASSHDPAQITLELTDTIQYYPGLEGQTSYLDFVLMTQKVVENTSSSQPFEAKIHADVIIEFEKNGKVIEGSGRNYSLDIDRSQPNIVLPYGSGNGSYEDIQALLRSSMGEITAKATVVLTYGDEYDKHNNFPSVIPPEDGSLPEEYVKFNASCRVHSNASNMNAGSHGNATDSEIYYCGIEKEKIRPQLNYYLIPQTNPDIQFNNAGINALSDMYTSMVDSHATYIAIGVEDPLSAAGLRCTLTISRKTDAGTYERVFDSPEILWDAPEIDGRLFALNEADGSYVCIIPNDSTDNPFSTYYRGISGDYDAPIISFPITLKIKSHTSEASPYYANYQAVLSVELIDKSGNAFGMASDPAIYTKAKISTTVF